MPENVNDKLKRLNDIMAKANEKKMLQNTEERKMLIAQLGADLGDILRPILAQMAKNSKITAQDLKDAMSNITISTPMEPKITVNVPDIQVPEANVNVTIPEIRVPTPVVNYTPPPINIPDFPKKMEIDGWIRLMGYDVKMLRDPLPVQLRDKDGKPVNLFESLQTMIVGGGQGGGGFRHVKVDNFADFAASSGVTDAQLRAAHLDVQQVSGAVDSVSIVSVGAALDVKQVSGAVDSVSIVSVGAALDVKQVSGDVSSVIVNDVLVSIQTKQVSGEVSSVYVNNPVAQGDAATALRVIIAGNSDASVTATQGPAAWDMKQVSGSVDSVIINDTLKALDVKQVSGDVSSVVVNSTLVSLDVKQMSGDVSSVVVNSVLVSLEQKQVSGFADSVYIIGSSGTTAAVGDIVSDGADNESAPVKVGGVARSTNPGKVADGDRVSASMDLRGRQLTRTQVRELTQTAYVQITGGAEATLIAGVASTFLDLMYIMGANNSDAAVSVDIRSGTGGSVIMTIEIPAYGTAGGSLNTPFPQEIIAGAWTVDMPDISGTTVSITALFSKEV